MPQYNIAFLQLVVAGLGWKVIIIVIEIPIKAMPIHINTKSKEPQVLDRYSMGKIITSVHNTIGSMNYGMEMLIERLYQIRRWIVAMEKVKKLWER